MAPEFSIVIPYYALASTIDFVKRQLTYYHFNSTPMAVILAVTGDTKVIAELESFIQNLADDRFKMLTTVEVKSEITNWESFLSRISATLKTVGTTYVIINGADDVIIPEAAIEGTEILSNNLDVAAVKGYTICFDCDSGKILALKDSELLDNSPVMRLKDVLKDRDSIFYIIRRTKDLSTEYDNILNLLKKSPTVRNSPYHIEHFIALCVASLGKVRVFNYPWRLATGHKNNHSSHTEGSFLRVEHGVLDKANYEWFKSVNPNMRDLSYNYYRFLWELHQVRGISVTLKQIAYHFLYKNSGFINSARISTYFVLHKLFIIFKRLFSSQVDFLNVKDNFFKPEHYSSLKKYYFSEHDIKLIESKVWG